MSQGDDHGHTAHVTTVFGGILFGSEVPARFNSPSYIRRTGLVNCGNFLVRLFTDAIFLKIMYKRPSQRS